MWVLDCTPESLAEDGKTNDDWIERWTKFE